MSNKQLTLTSSENFMWNIYAKKIFVMIYFKQFATILIKEIYSKIFMYISWEKFHVK